MSKSDLQNFLSAIQEQAVYTYGFLVGFNCSAGTLQELKGAATDVKNLEQWLRTTNHVRVAEIFKVICEAGGCPHSNNHSFEYLKQKYGLIDSAINDTRPSEKHVWHLYAGHGFRSSCDGIYQFIVPPDANWKHKVLNLKELDESFRNLEKFRLVIHFLDCCRIQPPEALERKATQAINRQDNTFTAVIAACGLNRSSREREIEGSISVGELTSALVDALSYLNESDKPVTIGKLLNRIRECGCRTATLEHFAGEYSAKEDFSLFE